jgi:hypothetical protein
MRIAALQYITMLILHLCSFFHVRFFFMCACIFLSVSYLFSCAFFSGSEDQEMLLTESIKHAKEAVMLDITDGNSWCKSYYPSILQKIYFHMKLIHQPEVQ